MIHHEENNNAQLNISHEVLLLLKWLIIHEEKRLQKMIAKVLNKGLHLDIQNLKPHRTNQQEMSHIVNDFFTILENSLSSAITNKIAYNQHHHHMIPALDKIDSSFCDNEIIRSSLEKASTEFAKDPQKNNASEMFFHEILKKWKPNSKINH